MVEAGRPPLSPRAPHYSKVECALHLVVSRVGKPWAPWIFWEPGWATFSVMALTGDRGPRTGCSQEGLSPGAQGVESPQGEVRGPEL